MPVALADVRRAAETEARRTFADLETIEVELDETVDWQGEPSLDIRVVVPDETIERKDVGPMLLRVGDAIRTALRDLGEQRFAYVGLTALSERDAAL